MSGTTGTDFDLPMRPTGWRGVLLIGLGGFLIAFLMQGRVDGSDTSAYLRAAQALWAGEDFNPESWFHIRIVMSFFVGLFAAPFDWPAWSWTLFPALCSGVVSGCCAYALRTWLPRLSWRSIPILSLAIPGLVKAGAMLYPDAPQAAFLSLGLLLLFRPRYTLPSYLCAAAAGLCFGLMIGVNPTSMRFGIIVLILAAVWYRRVEYDERIRFMRAAGICGFAVFGVLMLVGLIHYNLCGDAMLLYKQLSGGGVAAAPSGRIDGLAALERWGRGAFGPWGEFGLYSLGVVFGLLIGRARIEDNGKLIALTWLGVVVLTIVIAIIPQMLDERAGAGEISTRYVIPGTIPVVMMAGATMVAFRNKVRRRRAVLIVAAGFCGMALLFNHKPRFFTEGPEDSFAFLHAFEGEPEVFATPRLALQLSQLWGKEVKPIDQTHAGGVIIVSAEEEALLARKYGSEAGLALPAGLKLGEEIEVPVPPETLWQSTSEWLNDQKRSMLGRGANPTRSKVFKVVRD